MFICPVCKSKMTLPKCTCGHLITKKNNIWQLTDAPNIVTTGDGDKYIGYEHIGEAYSGKKKHIIEEADVMFAKEISQITKDGFFLDIACGDGCFTVPCAKNGTKILAADISNHMLTILQQKAAYNNISLDNVTLCRMNALDIPLEDASVDTVVANSVLHLISNPQKVIKEIHRVLKKGGILICKDDAPGKQPETPFDNSLYTEIVNHLYSEYWNILKSHGVFPKKYSWKFERSTFCDQLFSEKNEKIIKRSGTYTNTLKDGFLPRFFGRGFSDQVDVPMELHDKVISTILSVFREKNGNDFDEISFKGLEHDMVITMYYK